MCCCSTVDSWEYAKKIYPGTLLFNWLVRRAFPQRCASCQNAVGSDTTQASCNLRAQVEMSSYLKYDLKVLPMVGNGNEGQS